MNALSERRRPAILFALTVALAGCTSYVKQEQYDSAITELRNADENLQTQINGRHVRSVR